MTENKNILVIGLGSMGYGIAKSLMRAEYKVYGQDKNPDQQKKFFHSTSYNSYIHYQYKNSNKINNSTLEIMIKRGKEIDIEYSKNKIIDKINAYFGYKVLEKIKIVTFDRDETYNEEVISNESKKKFHSNIKNVKDESLKRSLSNLIKVFKSK